jgi:hypothetical protein
MIIKQLPRTAHVAWSNAHVEVRAQQHRTLHGLPCSQLPSSPRKASPLPFFLSSRCSPPHAWGPPWPTGLLLCVCRTFSSPRAQTRSSWMPPSGASSAYDHDTRGHGTPLLECRPQTPFPCFTLCLACTRCSTSAALELFPVDLKHPASADEAIAPLAALPVPDRFHALQWTERLAVRRTVAPRTAGLSC